MILNLERRIGCSGRFERLASVVRWKRVEENLTELDEGRRMGEDLIVTL